MPFFSFLETSSLLSLQYCFFPITFTSFWNCYNMCTKNFFFSLLCVLNFSCSGCLSSLPSSSLISFSVMSSLLFKPSIDYFNDYVFISEKFFSFLNLPVIFKIFWFCLVDTFFLPLPCRTLFTYLIFNDLILLLCFLVNARNWPWWEY